MLSHRVFCAHAFECMPILDSDRSRRDCTETSRPRRRSRPAPHRKLNKRSQSLRSAYNSDLQSPRQCLCALLARTRHATDTSGSPTGRTAGHVCAMPPTTYQQAAVVTRASRAAPSPIVRHARPRASDECRAVKGENGRRGRDEADGACICELATTGWMCWTPEGIRNWPRRRMATSLPADAVCPMLRRRPRGCHAAQLLRCPAAVGVAAALAVAAAPAPLSSAPQAVQAVSLAYSATATSAGGCLTARAGRAIEALVCRLKVLER